MKTTSYNTEKEIKIGILVAVFAISVFTAVRVKELQLNDASNMEQSRSSHVLINKENTPSMPTLNAKLIEEPVPAVGPLLQNTEYKASAYVESEITLESERFFNGDNEAIEAELAIQVKPWMTATEYKATGYANADMALESERFFNSEKGAIEAELALQINPSITATEYKATDYANAEMASERFLNAEYEAIEPELALQVKQWMTAMDYKATDYTNAEMTLESERFLNGNATINNIVARTETAEGVSILAIQ